MSQADEPRPRKPYLWIGTVLLVILMIGGAAFLLLHRRAGTRHAAQQLAQSDQEGHPVETAQVQRSKPEKTLLLIGESRPYYSVTLYARVSGYLVDLRADIGDTVKQGQLLARVESPESEQAYTSARADAINRKRIANRMKVLLARRLVSPQEAEQSFAAADIADATLRTQSVIRNYQSVSAPFDGRISQRFVDPGALIQNASTNPGSQPLFTLSQTRRLRVFAYVDQKDAPFVRTETPVLITLPGQPGPQRNARIERIAGELDVKTRTLLTEVVLDNPEEEIVPGSFVEVQMRIATPQFLKVPAQALVMKDQHPYVPVIGPKGDLHYAPIDLMENDGTNLLIRSGVEPGQQVALNTGNTLREGQHVKTERPRAEAGKAPPGGPGK